MHKDPWSQVPAILASLKPPTIPQQVFDITRHGAARGEENDSRPGVIRAIERCRDAGGGRVFVPEGTYRIDGPLYLYSNIELHLERGARLRFAPVPSLYEPLVESRWEGVRLYMLSALVRAHGSHNLAVTGEGTIDGRGSEGWVEWGHGKVRESLTRLLECGRAGIPVEERRFGIDSHLRPPLIQFHRCGRVLVEGVTLVDSPFWCVHPLFCTDVTVRGVKFDSRNPNNDGIDVDSCRGVLVEQCLFANGDDNIAIKSGQDEDGRDAGEPSEDIVVRDCTFNNYTGIAVGSEMSGGVQRVFVENCRADSRLKRGVYVKGNRHRGGFVRDVYVRNVDIRDCSHEVIKIGTDYGGAHGGDHPPRFERIALESIRASGPAAIGISLVGEPDAPLRDIRLRDIDLARCAQPLTHRNAGSSTLSNVRVNGNPVSL